jgi:hypothetical protein
MWAFVGIFSLLVMEATLASLWYQAIFRPGSLSFGGVALIVFTILVISHGMARVAGRLKWRMVHRQAVLLGWIVIATFASLKLMLYTHNPLSLWELVQLPIRFILWPDGSGINFFHLLYIIILIWRGVALARGPLTLRELQISFQIGLIFLLFYGMLFAPAHPQEATLGMYIFLFSGLTSMSSTRISTLSGLRGGRIAHFGRGWMLTIGLASLGLVGLAILIGWLASGNIVFFLATLLAGLFSLLTALLLFLLTPLLVLLADLLPQLSGLVQRMLQGLRGLGINEQILKFLQQFNEGLTRIVPLILAGRGIFLAAILIAVLLSILLALRLRDLYQRKLEEDEDSSIDPDETNNLLQRLLNRLWDQAQRLRLRGPAQMLAAARVRQIYRHMLLLAQKMGAPRPPSDTPLEFLPRLETLFPDEQAGAAAITSAYLKVRYGEYPETRGEIEEIEQAWKRLRRQARRTLAAKKRGAS